LADWGRRPGRFFTRRDHDNTIWSMRCGSGAPPPWSGSPSARSPGSACTIRSTRCARVYPRQLATAVSWNPKTCPDGRSWPARSLFPAERRPGLQLVRLGGRTAIAWL